MTFLSKLSDPDRAALAARWSMRRFAKGETIIAHGEESGDVFFLLDGHARATVFSEDGRAVAYRDLDPGDIFGELAAIDGMPRSATIVALDSMSAAQLSAPVFKELVASRPGFAWELLRHLSRQTRTLSERVYEFSTLVVRKRLIRELLRLGQEMKPEERALSIIPAPKHFDLAAKISTHREAVSREMSALAKRKLIEKRGRALVLLDPGGLQKLAGEGD